MRKLIIAIAFCAASLIGGAPAVGQAPAAPRPPAVSERDADAVIQNYLDAQRFSGAVLVARGDKVLLRKGYGLADREWNVPATPEAVFRIGSITKQFTAALILKLAEQGKLSLDDPVAKHYPEAPAAWSKITVRHLLDHTSGIPSYTGLPGFFETMSRTDRKPAEIVRLTQDKPLEFEPGSKFSYNNTGYVLLGAIVEKVTGKPYAEVLKAELLDPLGLNRTGYEEPSEVVPQRAKGYQLDGARIVNAPYLSMTLPYAAGSMYSTVDDLFSWARALHGGKVMPAAAKTAMFTDHRGHTYGYGQMILKNPELGPMLGHGGGINGFSSMLSYFPDHDLTVVVLSNTVPAPSQQIAAELARLYAKGPAPPGQQVAVSEAELKAYAGAYQLGSRFVLRVAPGKDLLLVQGTDQPPVAFRPIGARTFESKGVGAKLVFEPAAGGSSPRVTVTQGGVDRTGKRIAAPEANRIEATPRLAPTERVAVAADPTTFDRYVGRYQLPAGRVLDVTREGEKLYVQGTGSPRTEAFAEAPDRFFVKTADYQFTFAPGEKAPKVTVHQGGLETEAPRIN